VEAVKTHREAHRPEHPSFRELAGSSTIVADPLSQEQSI